MCENYVDIKPINKNKPLSTASLTVYVDFGDADQSSEMEERALEAMSKFLRDLKSTGANVISYEVDVDRSADTEYPEQYPHYWLYPNAGEENGC